MPCPKIRYQPKCGQHHPDGVFVTNTNPIEKEFATQFGEWPFVCLLYKVGVIGDSTKDIYVGGASLVAPGVLVTAAHTVQ